MSYPNQKRLANEIVSQGVVEYVVRREILFMHRGQPITILTGPIPEKRDYRNVARKPPVELKSAAPANPEGKQKANLLIYAHGRPFMSSEHRGFGGRQNMEKPTRN
jgi:hypothetical protein